VEAEKNAAKERTQKLLNLLKVSRTVDDFHKALGKIMWEYCGMARTAEGLTKARNLFRSLSERILERCKSTRHCNEFNPELDKAGRVADFIELGELMVIDALNATKVVVVTSALSTRTMEKPKRDDDNYTLCAAWEFKGVDATIPSCTRNHSIMRL
jgi:succinate dehydrogenase / fumarate reductase flavoprotein subunit